MDTKKLLELLTQNPAAGAAAGGLAGSILGNVLTGSRGGRKLAKYGGLAAVGYVAWQAWQKRQAQKNGLPAPTGGLDTLLQQVLGGGAGAAAGSGAPTATAAGATRAAPFAGASAVAGTGAAGAPPALPAPFDLEAPANSAQALRVVRAMIAASKADGSIDPAERERIFAKVGESRLTPAEHDEVLRLLGQPADLETIVAGVDSPELATEIYAASLLAVSPASRVERAWLEMLAARLGLEGELTLELDRSVEALVRQGQA